MERDLQREEQQIITRKIRIFPENKEAYKQALHTFRRAYNLSIEAFKLREEKPSSELRAAICKQISEEAPAVYDVNLIQEAYRAAVKTRSSIIRERKNGKTSDYSFMSWKHSPRHFSCAKLGVNGLIYPRQLGSVQYTEEIPDYAVKRCTKVVLQHGEWYACCLDVCLIPPIDENSKNIVALDPGVRNFIVAYSDNQACVYGESYAKEKLLPIALRVRRLVGDRQKLLNILSNYADRASAPAYIYEQLTCIAKKMDKLKARRAHLIEDLHKRVAYDIVMKNDIILLPSFQTSQMVKQNKRKIGRKIVSSMLDLCHYRFKLHLLWAAKKYGKIVLTVNEAYTSKTYNGRIMKNLGGKPSFSVKLSNGNRKIIDRDLNGSRNILIRFLSTRNVEVVN